MALTPERIDEIAGPADYFDRRVFARAIEAEVRKDDDALILQLVEALECHCEMTRSLVRSELAITAGRARLAPPPPTA
jgi:hypothetical protein